MVSVSLPRIRGKLSQFISSELRILFKFMVQTTSISIFNLHAFSAGVFVCMCSLFSFFSSFGCDLVLQIRSVHLLALLHWKNGDALIYSHCLFARMSSPAKPDKKYRWTLSIHSHGCGGIPFQIHARPDQWGVYLYNVDCTRHVFNRKKNVKGVFPRLTQSYACENRPIEINWNSLRDLQFRIALLPLSLQNDMNS